MRRILTLMPSDNGRRGFWACVLAAICSLAIPGGGHLAVRVPFRRAVAIVASLNVVATVAVVAIVAPLSSRSDLADVIANRTVFLGLALALAVLAATRLWSALDSAWLARPASGTAVRLTATATIGLMVIGGVAPLAIAANYVWQTDRAIERTFASGDAPTANPAPLPTTTTTTTTTTATTTTTTTTSLTTTTESISASTTTIAPTTTATIAATTTTAAIFPGVERVNVLLLGGDAGPGRFSLRTDSMVVVSIDPDTGNSAMISVPRNLQRLPFPAGTALAERYPDGFDEIANAVYTRVDSNRQLAGGGDDAGAQAIKLGIAQLLGIPIHYYVLVDMAGFVDVVDALGGIDIDVIKRVPSGGTRTDEKHPVPKWFEVGAQHMDGTLALSYARSRGVDSDYSRMGRQRCVLAGIAAAATPRAVAAGLTDLVTAFGAAVRTDIPRERLGEMSQLVDRYSQAGGLDAVRTLHLAPPLVDPADWDAAEVRALVANVLTPGAPDDGQPASTLGNACS